VKIDHILAFFLDHVKIILMTNLETRKTVLRMIPYGLFILTAHGENDQVACAAVERDSCQVVGRGVVPQDPVVVVGFLTSAMTLVGPTYAAEVSATLNYVRHELQQRGIRSCGSFFGKEGAAAEETPTEFSLGENYPNPFNPATTITFSIPSQASVSLEIFNILGQKVKTLADNKVYEGGVQSEMWDGKNAQGTMVPSGTYFSRLTTPGGVFMRKMMLMK